MTKDKTLKDKFIRYAVVKGRLKDTEAALIKELDKQLKAKGIKFTRGINEHSIESLKLTDEGVVFEYSIVDYNESTPASVLLK